MNSPMASSIREQARKLLESGEVSMVIGFAEGPTPARATPCFVTSAEQVDNLIWSPGCAQNLAVYLRDKTKTGKVAVVAKACDVRSISVLIQEKQLKREDLYILGTPCQGMMDMDSLSQVGCDEGRVRAINWEEGGVSVETDQGTTRIEATTAFKNSCLDCADAPESLHDETLPGPAHPDPVDRGETVPEDLDERRAFWAKQFQRCIRCYACRQVCPACYCTDCFADRQTPHWVSKRVLGEENWMYHVTRAMHLAGRCVGCGECERVCPVGIPLNLMTRKMAEEVENLFDYRAGAGSDSAPVLGSFRDNDEGPEG